MKEMLKDMWGGLVNVTTYKHVMVIAMFLVFLYLTVHKIANKDAETKINKWIENPTLKLLPTELKIALDELEYIGGEQTLKNKGYYKISDKELESELISQLNKKGYYNINDVKSVDTLRNSGFYKVDDTGIIEKISKEAKNIENDVEKIEDYYKKGLVQKLRELADKKEPPFDALKNYLRATVPREGHEPHSFRVNVSSNSNYDGKIIKLIGPYGDDIILLGKAALGNVDKHQIHLNKNQLSYLLGNDEYRGEIKFKIMESNTKLSDPNCFMESKFQTITQQLCPDGRGREDLKIDELKKIIN